MAKQKDENQNQNQKNEEIYCETHAQQRLIKVRLGELKVETELYCHRLGKFSDPKNREFQIFVNQIRRDGCVQVPIEVVRNKDGKTWTLIRGHRRRAACLFLVKEHQPGFSEDMELDAYEVSEANEQDLLVRSVSDNENRKSLTRAERIQAAYRMVKAKVPSARAANALGVSMQTFERDLVIAENAWMFKHFHNGDIKATQASDLLRAAIDGDEARPLPEGSRLKNLRDDFGRWVNKQKLELEELDARRQTSGKRPMRPADKLVHKRLPSFLVQHWLTLIRDGQHFAIDDEADWNYAVTLEKDTLRIPSVRVDVKKDAPEKLARVLAAIASVPEVILPALQMRKDEGDEPVSDMDITKGIELLREHGLENFASKIEQSRELKRQAARVRREAVENDGDEQPPESSNPPAEADIRDEIDTGEEDDPDEVNVPDEVDEDEDEVDDDEHEDEIDDEDEDEVDDEDEDEE